MVLGTVCWDFWGYTDADAALAGPQRRFAGRNAPQLQAVKAMADALLRQPRSQTRGGGRRALSAPVSDR